MQLVTIIFKIMMVKVEKKKLQDSELGAKVGNIRVPSVLFADDIGLSSEMREGLERL